jgi:hypothetical protein
VSRAVPGDEGDGRFGNLQLFCQKFAATLIGSPIHRGGGQAQLQLTFVNAAKLVAGGPGLDKDPQQQCISLLRPG